MHKIVTLLICRLYGITSFFLAIQSVASIRISCSYYTGEGWKILDGQYQCFASNVDSSTKSVVIDGFDGEHGAGKTNNNVKGLFMRGKSIKYVPKNIERHFPNLEGLWLGDTNIAEITSEDLKAFPELKVFSLQLSKLTHVGPSLFKFNTKLKYIDLCENQISEIAASVFDGLADLQEVDLSQNYCISMHAGNYLKIEEMKRLIRENCTTNENIPSTAARAESSKSSDVDVASLKEFIAEQVLSIQRASAEQIDDLKKVTAEQIDDPKKVIEELQQEVKKIHATNDNMTTF